uniref:ATP-dependent RNA helicase n=1 Tax=Syphacia muris TaxID=451379 RepID=A0A0N5AEK8_9BILA
MVDFPKNSSKKLFGEYSKFYEATEKDVFDLSRKPVTGNHFEEIYNDTVQIYEKSGSYEVIRTATNLIGNFDDMNLPKQLLDNIKRLKFKNPLPIQKATFPYIENGSNVFAIGSTCSGKTAAFLIPVIKWIILTKEKCTYSMKTSPCCIVLSSTKELAEQSYNCGCALSYNTSCVCLLSIGGTSVYNDKKKLVKGCDILFCTIGRLSDYVDKSIIRLNNLHFLVLDDAELHVSSSNSFEDESQTLVFSATESEELKTFLNDLAEKSSFTKVVVGNINAVNPHVKQAIVPVAEDKKRKLLLELLMQPDIQSIF